MLTKFVVAFAILTLALAFAGDVPAKAPVAHITLSKPAVVNGTALKAGDYRLIVGTGKVTFIAEKADKQAVDVPAKIENGQKKFDQNQVQYDNNGAQTSITEICLGGTKTRVLFN